MDTDDRAKLYLQFLEQAAKEYRCTVDDMPAKMAATRRLSFEVYQARLIEGRDVEPATLRWFLEEEAKHAPPADPLGVDIRIVDGTACPTCGGEKIDLKNLDDRELKFLEYLILRAHGVKARKVGKEFSAREFAALALARKVDAVVKAKREADATELAQIHGSLDSLIFPLVSLAALHRRFDPSIKEVVPPPTPPDPPPSAPPPTKTKSSPPASSAPANVVELPRPRSAGEPITDTMRRFNQLRGYCVAPDGRLGRGNPSRGGAVW
jgi:hypothetical protein